MEGRIIQVVLLLAIFATIGGSLMAEFYLGAWLRRRRVRRRHRHAAELLKVYRDLRRQARARQLVRAMALIRDISSARMRQCSWGLEGGSRSSLAGPCSRRPS